jgi:predicted ester cyclase
MSTPAHPLEVYRRFQSYLLTGEFGRLGEVADLDSYTENCVGLTGWTTGLATALRNFQENIASRLTDMAVTEHDVIEAGDTLVIRGTFEVTHSGEFLGVAPTGRRVCYDWIDMYRVADGRIVWRYLLCDWKGLLDRLTAAA